MLLQSVLTAKMRQRRRARAHHRAARITAERPHDHTKNCGSSPTTNRHSSGKAAASVLLGRDHDHHDQCQDAEEQSKNAPAQWVAALHRGDGCANNRRDNAADRDENAFDAAQNKSCGLRLAGCGQYQFVKNDDLLAAARGLAIVLRTWIPAKAGIKTCAPALAVVMGR
jgi:hypothetical protein